MALYRIADDRLETVRETSFSEERIFERKDLQRLLKADIATLGEDIMVLAEEFSDWEDSSRRIDLLCLDKKARLVVVEIKRTEDGGHMELQAIRYAAMVSGMTLDRAISLHAKMLGGESAETKAREEIIEFLDQDSSGKVGIKDEIRIILISADFSTEVTTSVLWLNKQGLDITCLRLKPYKLGNEVLLDMNQIIPLPEAADYEIKLREQAQENKKVQTARQEIFRRFWSQVIDRSRNKTQLIANRSTTSDHWLSAGIGRSGFNLNMSLTEDRARIECYIRLGRDNDEQTQAAFNALFHQKQEIEKTFGDALEWQDLPNRIGCRICKDLEGGWKTPEIEWPLLQECMIETLIRLETALKGPIQALKI